VLAFVLQAAEGSGRNEVMSLVMRACLKCDKKFLSKWAGNRICVECRKGNRKIFAKRLISGISRSKSIKASE